MVWIHGGGWQEDSGSQNDYNGEPLSAVGEVIHVNINYRLNTFGFLTTGKLSIIYHKLIKATKAMRKR